MTQPVSTVRPAIDPVGELRRLFELQSKAQPRLRGRSAELRITMLRTLRATIEAKMEAIITALAEDLAKPRDEAMTDFGAPLWDIGLIEQGLAEWTKPWPVVPQTGATPGATAKIMHGPKGKVLIFGPWNFPFALVFQPLVAAVAAGNAVIVKPSEMAPATAAIATQIIRECFSEDEVAVVEGGPDVAEALLELPFDHIFFTGSTRTGRRVMAAAAEHLSSLTLELGGKCPAIIDHDVHLPTAVGSIMAGKCFNAGQVCLAPDHAWIAPALRDDFIAQLGQAIDAAYYEDGELLADRISRIVNQANADRLRRLLDDAIARGATVVRGGRFHDGFIEPTILVDVPPDAMIMEEEIFGPILPILTYAHEDEIVRSIERTGKPLALYVFSQRPAFVDAMISRTMSGGVTVNGVMLHASDAGLPFGGVGTSGMGAYHGAFGFAELTHRRSVYEQPVADEPAK
jgi:aldehyde dehydrogenase (NAD+)